MDETVFSTMMQEKLDPHRPKDKGRSLLHTICKTTPSECIKFHDIAFGNDFLDTTPTPQATVGKTDKLDYFKIKNFCASKDTTKRVKAVTYRLGESVCKSCV